MWKWRLFWAFWTVYFLYTSWTFYSHDLKEAYWHGYNDCAKGIPVPSED